MGCLTEFAKYILFTFNFLLMISASALIAIGAGALNMVNIDNGVKVHKATQEQFAIIIGSIIFVTGFLGCCGVIRSSRCMLTTYAVVLILVLILQVVLGAFAVLIVANSDKSLKQKVNKAVAEEFEKYRDDPSSQARLNFIKDLQENFKCCGVHGPSWYIEPENLVAVNGTQYCASPKDAKIVFTEGCGEAVKNAILDNLKAIAGIAIALATVELLGAIFACMVCKQKNTTTNDEYLVLRR